MRAQGGFAVLVRRGSSEGLRALFQTGAGWGACVHGVAGASSRRACCSEVALAEVAACRAMSGGKKCADGRGTPQSAEEDTRRERLGGSRPTRLAAAGGGAQVLLREASVYTSPRRVVGV